MARRLPPIHERAALQMSQEDHAAFEDDERVAHCRFRLPNSGGAVEVTPQPGHVEWNDMVGGRVTVDFGSLSDPVLNRADGSYLHTFCCVVDGADLGITRILRSEDHVTNTGVQDALLNAIGAEAPEFGHHSLLVGADGKVPSKRLGDRSIAKLREDGLEPWRWRATAHSLGHRMRLNRIAVCSLWRRCSLQRRSRWCLRGSI